MEIKKVLVSPDDAFNWLQNCNVSNRSLDIKRVQFYTKEILNGNWKEDTGEMIKFSKKGRLIDGQHRLQAVYDSKRHVFFHICYGLDDEVFSVIDTGKSRSASDALHVKGIKNSNVVSAIIQKNNAIKHEISSGLGKNKSLSNTELLKVYNDNPDYWDSVALKSMMLYKKINRLLGTSIIGGYMSVFDEKDCEKSNLFFEQLSTGKNVENSTIDVLRNKLIYNKTNRIAPYSNKVINVFLIKTWNAYRIGKEYKILKFDENVEEYPTIL